jgi:hypothetical protein
VVFVPTVFIGSPLDFNDCGRCPPEHLGLIHLFLRAPARFGTCRRSWPDDIAELMLAFAQPSCKELDAIVVALDD